MHTLHCYCKEPHSCWCIELDHLTGSYLIAHSPPLKERPQGEREACEVEVKAAALLPLC